MKIKISASILFLICSYSYGQLEQHTFKRELQGITNTWHKIVLPEDIFGKVSSGFNDIRILGLTESNDTIEASYMLQLQKEKVVRAEVDFKLFNTTSNEQGYFFTMEVPTEEPVNELKLNFKEDNFDWLLSLEGSQNQKEWYGIVDDYRILSIKNPETNYQFTKVTFPNTKYRFFRIHIKSKEKPNLSYAKIALNKVTNGSYNQYKINKIESSEDNAQKLTIVEVSLKAPVPVSSIKIGIKNTFDYYRPVTISYLADSIETEQGWKYRYQRLTSGTLNSIDNNEFVFESTILHKLKIGIQNQDNTPLTINTITAKGYVHELTARFTEPATYFLAYGNKQVAKPNYDIGRFTAKIPNKLVALSVGKEQLVIKNKVFTNEPLFKNKNWLWALMVIMIAVIGWFSIKMIRTK